ncbi:MAG: cobalt ECF transporter T component CbiQ [Nitrospirae bacterium]|nr:MAG: cobalt ECF transporter T component CbiQ [Nitrospirota bacterium]
MFDTEFFNLGYLDRLSYQNTFIHRIDPRIKLISSLMFIVAVVSFPKYAVTGLLPFFIFPVLFLTLGDIPFRFILKKILFVSPFAVFIGIFNPLLDSQPALNFLGFTVSRGWMSFVSIMLKFSLTISAALLLIATTSFPGICFAMQKLRIPKAFVAQLLFLYRYLFVLMEEAMKIVRARDMRSFNKRGKGIKHFVPLIGVLFIRTVDRAERVYNAMLARGFNGKIYSTKAYALTMSDILFIFASVGLILLFRVVNLTTLIGRWTTG